MCMEPVMAQDYGGRVEESFNPIYLRYWIQQELDSSPLQIWHYKVSSPTIKSSKNVLP